MLPTPWDVADGLRRALLDTEPIINGEEHSIFKTTQPSERSRNVVLDVEDERGQTYEVTITVLRVRESGLSETQP